MCVWVEGESTMKSYPVKIITQLDLVTSSITKSLLYFGLNLIADLEEQFQS